MNAKLLKLSKFQGKPLRKTDTSLKTLEDSKMQIYVREFLSYGPKHPIKNKFTEIHFPADIDNLVRNLHQKEIEKQQSIMEFQES